MAVMARLVRCLRISCSAKPSRRRRALSMYSNGAWRRHVLVLAMARPQCQGAGHTY